MSEQDSSDRLQEFAQHLRNLTFPTSPIPLALASFVASGIERYLSGEAHSLDAALKLPKRKRPRGRPPSIKRLYDREAAVVEARARFFGLWTYKAKIPEPKAGVILAKIARSDIERLRITRQNIEGMQKAPWWPRAWTQRQNEIRASLIAQSLASGDGQAPRPPSFKPHSLEAYAEHIAIWARDNWPGHPVKSLVDGKMYPDYRSYAESLITLERRRREAATQADDLRGTATPCDWQNKATI